MIFYLLQNLAAGFAGALPNLRLRTRLQNRLRRYNVKASAIGPILWKGVNKRMRSTERTWPTSRVEERSAYLRRLTRTAKNIPSDMVIKAVEHMQVRCERPVEAEGGQIEGWPYSCDVARLVSWSLGFHCFRVHRSLLQLPPKRTKVQV